MKDRQTSQPPTRGGIQSVGIGLRVLDAVGGMRQPAPLGMVAKACGLSPPQTHRYLTSLVAAGMVRQDEATGRYGLGPGSVRLGLSALAQTDAFQLTDLAIAGFTERTGRTVQVAALGPLGPTVVRWHAGLPPVMTSFNVGSVLPLLSSATGHVFLSFAPDNETSALLEAEVRRVGARDMLDVARIRRGVRDAGFAAASGSVAPGLRAISFPVFDLQGRPVLVATMVMTDAFDVGQDLAVQEDLRVVCGTVSERLGYSGSRWTL